MWWNTHYAQILTHWPLGDFKNVIFNLALLIGIFKSCDNILRWMPQDLTDDKSTLVQVMAWCRQATSHYLSQCWPRSPMPYGVNGPNQLRHYERFTHCSVSLFYWFHSEYFYDILLQESGMSPKQLILGTLSWHPIIMSLQLLWKSCTFRWNLWVTSTDITTGRWSHNQ